MKIKHLPWILSSSAALFLFSGYALIYPGGAPAAVTGSPGDGANCVQCHGGTATTTAGLITSNISTGGYIAGQTYQITATNNLSGSGNYGFEVSPQNAAGLQLGTLAAGIGSKLVSGGTGTKYITQSNATTTKTWVFSWIAPQAGTGPVTFYGAMARNFPGPVTLSSLTVQEALNTGIDENLAGIKVIAGASSGFINVVLNTNGSHVKIAVFDLSGRQLLRTSISGGGTHQLDQKFKTGLYIILVQEDGATLKKKIMVL